jgi:hypothetical protein
MKVIAMVIDLSDGRGIIESAGFPKGSSRSVYETPTERIGRNSWSCEMENRLFNHVIRVGTPFLRKGT